MSPLSGIPLFIASERIEHRPADVWPQLLRALDGGLLASAYAFLTVSVGLGRGYAIIEHKECPCRYGQGR